MLALNEGGVEDSSVPALSEGGGENSRSKPLSEVGVRAVLSGLDEEVSHPSTEQVGV